MTKDLIEEVGEDTEFEEVEDSDTEYSDPADFDIPLEVHAGEFDPSNVKMLVYGESGSGKTVFSSTFPRPIFLDIDKGMASITRKVHRIDVNSWEDIANTEKYLRSSKHPFRTIVIDSLNELQYISMNSIIRNFPNVRRPYSDLPGQSDYGAMLQHFEDMVRRFKAVKINLICICNVAPQEFETDLVQPQMIGKHMPRTISRMMDVIGYLYKGEAGSAENGGDKKPRIMVFDATNYVTKDRSDMLPPSVENPTYPKLYAYWKKRLKGDDNDV